MKRLGWLSLFLFYCAIANSTEKGPAVEGKVAPKLIELQTAVSQSIGEKLGFAPQTDLFTKKEKPQDEEFTELRSDLNEVEAIEPITDNRR